MDSKQSVWMPIYIGDYLKDTIGLTKAQHGAYFLTIMAYWSKGGPLTEGELKSVANPETKRVKMFFRKTGNLWHHKRIDAELSTAAAQHMRAVERGRKGAQARHLASSTIAKLETEHSSSPSPSPSHKNVPREASTMPVEKGPERLGDILPRAIGGK